MKTINIAIAISVVICVSILSAAILILESQKCTEPRFTGTWKLDGTGMDQEFTFTSSEIDDFTWYSSTATNNGVPLVEVGIKNDIVKMRGRFLHDGSLMTSAYKNFWSATQAGSTYLDPAELTVPGCFGTETVGLGDIFYWDGGKSGNVDKIVLKKLT